MAGAGSRTLLKLWFDTAMLAIVAQHVIGLRVIKLASGGESARAETSRMVAEKITASIGMTSTLLRGGSPASVMKQYRRAIRSNFRRLTR